MAQIIIQKGDNLSKIAFQNKTTIPEILKLNPQIKNPDIIFAGNTLNLPELSEQKNLPITSSIQGDSPETLIQRIQEQKGEMPKTNLSEERVSSAPIIFNSTDNLRNENKIKKIKEELNLGEKPVSPFSFSETDKTKLETTTDEVAIIQKRSEEIFAEKLKLEEEVTKFEKIAGEGVSEFGREAIVSEQNKRIKERLDSLNREELLLETKLNNRNVVISNLMSLKRQDYQDAVLEYNTKFSQALQLYNIIDKEGDEFKIKAKASLDVLSNVYNSQIKSGEIKVDNIPKIKQTQLEELELQSELPIGSTMAVLRTLKPTEEKLGSGVNKQGEFWYAVKNANGDMVIKKARVSEPEIVKGISQDNNLFPNIDKISATKLKTNIKDVFSKEFANKLILEFNDEQLREFVRDYETAQNEAQQSIDPEIALKEWKAVNMLEKKSSSKTATNLSDEEFSDEEIGKLFELGYTSEEILDFENKGISFKEIKKR